MLNGNGQIKPKSIKYLGQGKFEFILTEVSPSDAMDLLSFDGDYVQFNFYTTTKQDGEIKADPQTGRLFKVVNGVVEYVDSTGEPIEESETEETIGEAEVALICDNCQNCGGIAKEDDKVLEVDCNAWTEEVKTSNICEHFMERETEPEQLPSLTQEENTDEGAA